VIDGNYATQHRGTPPALPAGMHMSLRLVSILATLSILPLAACTASDDDDGGDADASVAGQAVYRDSTTDHDGAPAQPATPEPQPVEVTLVIEGTGTIPDPDPQCAIDPAGAFQATFDGSATLSDGGAYLAALGEGTITTPSGCAIPDLTVGVITDVRVRAAITATTENCQSYCEASARADAEAECGATASAAECRAAAEADAVASCTTECTSETHQIVAEVSLAASLLGDLDADALRAAAFGELTADLTFDTIE